MPDATRATISASQSAALFGVSPYLTPRMLYDFLHDDISPDAAENDRMAFGKFLQPYILRKTAERLNLEVIANEKDEYIRHPSKPLGTTLDAHLVCPTRGYGIVEAKNVSWMVFKDNWTGNKAPIHVETQVQQQMMIPHPTYGLPRWGTISVMIGADEDFQIFERRPDEKVFRRIEEEAVAMMARVANNNRPPVMGNAMELRGLEALIPEIIPTKKLTDLSNVKLGQMLLDLARAQEEATFWENNKKQLRVKVLDQTGDHGLVHAFGAMAKISRSKVDPQKTQLPYKIKTPLQALADAIDDAIENDKPISGLSSEAIRAALAWEQTLKTGYVVNRFKIEAVDDGEPPADDADWEPKVEV